MKILMLCDFYNESLEYQENLLTKYYTKHHHEVTVIASTYESIFDLYSDNYDNNAPARTYYDGKAKIIKLRNYFKIRFKLMNRLRIYTSILPLLEQECPDLIYVHDIMLNIFEVLKYKKTHPDCKIILDMHADYTNSAKNWLSLRILHKTFRRFVLNQARAQISKFFPITPESARFLREVYNVQPAEMELLPLGADTDLGKECKTQEKGRKLRASLGIPETDIVVFTGGKLHPLKKTELILDVFKEISQPNLHLIIIGTASEQDKAYEALLRAQAANIQNIHFTGWLNSREVYPYLDMADLAVFPASQSILWQQAISMELPLIVGDMGGQDVSYLNGHDNIRILKQHEINQQEIKKHLLELIYNDELRAKMKAGAIKVTEELLNWDRLINKTLMPLGDKFSSENIVINTARVRFNDKSTI